MSKVLKVLYDAATIAARVRELGAEIARDYRDREPVMVMILSGSFVFAADLIRAMDCPLNVDFLGVRSYGDDMKSTGVVRITHDLARSIEGRDVIIVEDIVDTGLTLGFLIDTLRARSPKSIKVAALLGRPLGDGANVSVDYLGFSLRDDVFVVGYGLDHAQLHRNLPDIVALEPDS